jgi:tRNA pseudouridine38-40 synthase
MKYKLTLEYLGTKYKGWQMQKGVQTVQGKLLDAAKAALQVPYAEIYGAGRTDAGVHALAQVAHLQIEQDLPITLLKHKLNDELPSDINILEVEKVSQAFHARHDAVARSYIYLIAKRRSALHKSLLWWIKDKLNTQAISQAALDFHGLNDFRLFTDEEEKSTKALIHFVQVQELDNLLVIHVVGSHFLWKMVRRMVGMLVEIGRGKLPENHVQTLLEGKAESIAEFTAPPSGLFLERVYYGQEKLSQDYKLPLWL